LNYLNRFVIDNPSYPYTPSEKSMNLKTLKSKTPVELLALAEEQEIENASTLRKQDMMFAILKRMAEKGEAIFGGGVVEILQDGLPSCVHLRPTIYQVPMISMSLLVRYENLA
jgi:transcription termination factor Rho